VHTNYKQEASIKKSPIKETRHTIKEKKENNSNQHEEASLNRSYEIEIHMYQQEDKNIITTNRKEKKNNKTKSGTITINRTDGK